MKIVNALAVLFLILGTVNMGIASENAGIEPVWVDVQPIGTPITEQQEQTNSLISIQIRESGYVTYVDFANEGLGNVSFYGLISVGNESKYLETSEIPVNGTREIGLVISRQNYELAFNGYGCCDASGNSFPLKVSEKLSHGGTYLNTISDKLYPETVEPAIDWKNLAWPFFVIVILIALAVGIVLGKEWGYRKCHKEMKEEEAFSKRS